MKPLTVKEFASAAELRDHYKQVFARRPERRPAIVPEPQPEPQPEPPIAPVARPIATMRDIILAVVSERSGIPAQVVLHGERKKAAVDARRRMFWLARHAYNARTVKPSLPDIGMWFGRRDHTTVLHHLRHAEYRRKRDTEYREQLDDMLREVFERNARMRQ